MHGFSIVVGRGMIRERDHGGEIGLFRAALWYDGAVRAAVAAMVLSTVFLFSLTHAVSGKSGNAPVVLILVDDGLTWTSAEDPGLSPIFDNGAVASLSTSQGRPPEDPRMGYALLGAGARADTSILPETLPREREKIPGSFTGPAATVRPGALGDALARHGVRAAAVGKRAALVVMDSKGGVSMNYGSPEPAKHLKDALRRGADLVAVEATGTRQAAEVSAAAREAGAAVAITAPNAPAGSANLTPFALAAPGSPDGVLYSPGTRTAGLMSNEDVAPTLLDRLGVRAPPEMAGRAAEVRPGSVEQVSRLQERLAFVDEERSGVWALLVGMSAAAFVLGGILRRRAGVRLAVLFLAALPLGTLAAAAVPVTNAGFVAVFASLVAGVAVVLSRRFSDSPLGWVALATATVVISDAALGGGLMRFSILGHDPAYGTRFYGIGNEYSAVVAGALPLAAGLLVARTPRLLTAVPVVGVLAVLAIGLPTMGADVGGSLALGFGLGATVGLLRGERLTGLALWAGGGLFLAAALFLSSGILFPDASHGARAASGEAGLYEIVVRKLILSLRHLLNPLWTALLVAEGALILMTLRRLRDTADGSAITAGMLGATAAAVASGALNDSGILATLLALAYPASAAAIVLLDKDRPRPGVA